MRFLHGALLILVLFETLQFSVFREVSKDPVCLFDTTCLGGSESESREVLGSVHLDADTRPIPLLLAALKIIHEKNWERLGVLGHCHPQASP